MATVNPYDRREARSPREIGAHYGEMLVDVDGDVPGLLADGRAAYPGFGLGRLEEILRDEFARGFNAGEGTLERKMEEDILPRVKRRAWDEGHEAGVGDGEASVCERAEEKFGLVVHEVILEIEPILANERSTVKELRGVLSSAVSLLEQLVKAHHDGFAPPPPF